MIQNDRATFPGVRFSVLILVVTSLASSGCLVPPEPPVWMSDSSAIVVGDTVYSIERDARRRLPELMAGNGQQQMAEFIDTTAKRRIHAVVDWDQEAADRVRLKITSRDLWDDVPLDSATLEIAVPYDSAESGRKGAAELHGLEILPGPAGEMLVCLGPYTVLVDRARTQARLFPDLTPPLYFRRLFGISPCRPDGGGFIAFQRKAAGQRRTDRPKSWEDFRSQHTAVVFVRWDGTVTALGDIERLRPLDLFFPVPMGQQIPQAVRFPWTSRWHEGSVLLEFASLQIELNTKAAEVHVRGGDIPDEERMRILEESLFKGTAVALEGGTTFVVRRRRVGSAGQYPGLPQELVLREAGTNSERVIDVSTGLRWFDLYPSPDRKLLLVLCTDFSTVVAGTRSRPTSDYGVLLSSEGKFVTGFGIQESDWLRQSIDRHVGLPKSTRHPRWGIGYEISESTCTERTLDFMLLGTEPFRELRDTEYLSLNVKVPSGILPEITALSKFPKLKYLGLGRSASPAAVGIQSLKSLEGLSGELTDELIEKMSPSDRLRALELHPAPPVTRPETGEPGPSLTRAGVSQLRKFPNLRDLVLTVPDEPPEQPAVDLSALVHLQTLDISSKSKSVTVSGLEAMPQLQRLRVNSNLLTQSTLGSLTAARSLQSLELVARRVEDLRKDSLVGLSQLRSLDLQVHGEFRNSLLDCIGRLSELESLKIAGTVREPIRLDGLRGLRALKTLELRIHGMDSRGHPLELTGVSIEPVSTLTTLESLALYSIVVPARELKLMSQLRSLRRGHLGKIDGPEAELQALSASVPGARLTMYVARNGTVGTLIYRGGTRQKSY